MAVSEALEHLRGCSPEARYVLIRLWVKHSQNLPIKLTVSECAIMMAMSRATTSRALDDLVEMGHLDVTLETNRKGRKSRIFDISGNLKKRLQGLDRPDAMHQKQIQHLFSTRKTDLKLDEKGALSASNIVLAAALLGHANPCFVVRGTGTAKLRLLTGMSTQRLRLQLDKFQKAKLFYHSVSGVAGSRILGLTTSTYWLSLTHPVLTAGSSSECEAIAVNLPSTQDADQIFNKSKDTANPGEVVVSIEKPAPWKRTEEMEQTSPRPNLRIQISLRDLHPFFNEYSKAPFRAAFELKLDAFASHLARAYCIQTVEHEPHSKNLHLLRKVYAEFFPKHVLSKLADPNTPTKAQRKALVKLVVVAASRIACEAIAAVSPVTAEKHRIQFLEIAPLKLEGPKHERLLIVRHSAVSNQTTPKDLGT